VLRTQPDSHRLANGNVHYPHAHNVVFCNRISAIDTDVIRPSDEFRIRAAELPVGSGIVEVPEELLTRNLDDRRVLWLIPEIDRRPYSLSHEHQDRQNDSRRYQENRFDLRIIVPIRGMLVPVSAVSGDKETKRTLNEHKRDAGND